MLIIDVMKGMTEQHLVSDKEHIGLYDSRCVRSNARNNPLLCHFCVYFICPAGDPVNTKNIIKIVCPAEKEKCFL